MAISSVTPARLKRYRQELDKRYAPVDTPVFTGTPQAPTPGSTALGTQVATVDYVKSAAPSLSSILQVVYPVGAIYISAISTSPADLFGFGTWEQLPTGVMLLSAGTDDSAYPAGSTGGEAAHTLTADELPKVNLTGSVKSGQWWSDNAMSEPTGLARGRNGGTTTVNIGSIGGGKAHNNMPPYLAVYMWKRTK